MQDMNLQQRVSTLHNEKACLEKKLQEKTEKIVALTQRLQSYDEDSGEQRQPQAYMSVIT